MAADGLSVEAVFPDEVAEATFQDRVANSLLSDVDQAKLEIHQEQPWLDGEDLEAALNTDRDEFESEDDPEAEPDEIAEGEPSESLEATPQERQAYAQGLNEFDRLPQAEQLTQINDILGQAYDAARQGIDRETAVAYCNQVGPELGAPNLAKVVDPVTFATFSETWSNHLETNVRLHPAAPAFMKALQSGNEARAHEAAKGLCNNPLMLEFFKDHLGAAIGKPEYVAKADPLELAASWIVVGARLMGWDQRPEGGSRQRPRQGSSPFQSNADIFDDETLARFKGL